MRALPYILIALLVLVQGALWLGKGGVPHTSALRAELAAQEATNEAARQRNERLTAEVADLQSGTEIIEERARTELSMIREGELLVVVTPAATGR